MHVIEIARTGGPEVLDRHDRPIPKPGPDEVLIKAHAIGVAYFDMLIRTGRYPWMPPLPYVPGNEMTGHIVDGNGTGLSDGQAVYVANWDNDYKGGFYAEYLVASAKAVRRLAPGTDLDRAAALSNYVVATCLLDYAVRFPFETLAVHGAAGGMGLALIELARLAGAKAIGIAGGAEKCALVQSRGADAIDHTREDIVARVRELSGGRGADVICNHMAGDTLKRDLTMLAPFGLLVSYGALLGLPQSDLFRDMRAVVAACPAVRCFTMHSFDHAAHLRDRATEKVLKLLAEKRIDPVLGPSFALTDAQAAHRALEARGVMGKIILKP
jgi:NADPH2:quinone reductase